MYAYYVKGTILIVIKGCILQEKEKYTEAIQAYSLGLEGNPMDISCLKGITQSYFLMHDFSGAATWAQTWLNYLGPSKVFNFNLICRMLIIYWQNAS